MSEITPGALSLEDAPDGAIESPPIQQQQAAPEPDAIDDDAPPEGVSVHDGKVDVSVLAAERRRVREATARAVREKEVAPLQQKANEADQLRQALNEAQPYLDHLRKHPELLQAPKPTPLEDQVSDEDALAEARDLELYDSRSGQPDVTRAKRIIARRRQDAMSAAQAATQAAVGPITSQTAQSVSRQNFVAMATRRDASDQQFVDPKVLAEMWAQLPPELTQHAEVGELILDAAIGKTVRTGGRVARAERAPVVSEPSGGQVGPQYQMDRMAKQIAAHAGITPKQFADSAKGYQPGQTNVIGE